MLLVQGFVYQQFLQLTENGLRVIFEEAEIASLWRICALVFGLFATRAALSYAVPRIAVWLAGNAIYKLRSDLIGHYLKLDLAFFERTKVGDTILRLFTQADSMGNFVGVTTVNAVRDFVTVVIVAGYLIWKSPILFLAAAIFIPVVIVLMQRISHTIKEIQANAENAFGDYINTIEEMSNGMRTVKISGQEERERDRLIKASWGIRDLVIRLQAAQALVAPSIDLISAFAYVLVIGGGGYMVISGDFSLDAAGIITFLLGLTILFDPARRLASFFAHLQASLILLDSLNSILRLKATISDREGARAQFDASADITLDGVTFAYQDGPPLFDGLDLTLKGGKTTAIVGATGSGKSTVIRLITRAYGGYQGSIRINGRELREIPAAQLHRWISVVHQGVFLFGGSVAFNMAMDREVPRETLARISRYVHADIFIQRLPGGLDAPVNQGGINLSAGQGQLISLARALVAGSDLIVMDEATSSVDSITEGLIQDAVEKIYRDRTVIAIAHRLSTIRDADTILVMEQGHIVEAGNHRELLARGGSYAELVGKLETVVE